MTKEQAVKDIEKNIDNWIKVIKEIYITNTMYPKWDSQDDYEKDIPKELRNKIEELEELLNDLVERKENYR